MRRPVASERSPRRRPSSLPLAVWAFARKEAFDVLRQPRLLLTLVLGPFAILLAFGLGYRNEVRPFRTVFVGDPNAALTQEIEASASRLGPLVELDAIQADEAEARKRLADGEIDAVVILPSDPLGTVLQGQRAVLRILHTRLDPVELTVISFASRLAVAEVNATVVASVVSAGQGADGPVAELLASGAAATDAALADVDGGDLVAAEDALGELDGTLRRLDLAASSASALAGDTAAPGGDDGTDDGASADDPVAESARALGATLREARRGVDAARQALGSGDTEVARRHLEQARTLLQEAPARAEQLMAVDAQVLVQPFAGEVENAVPGERTFTDYYAPAAVVLLLQQFGVAFAALTFVREAQLGAAELYRVAPVGARQVVVGKYLGHFVIGGLVAAALVLLVTAGLGVPLLGPLSQLALSLGLVVLASIGLGFVISLTSRTDMQAVLSTMLVLLAALFFSGFFLPTEQLQGAARAVAWLLPATYGIDQARDVMLRGDGLDRTSVTALSAYALGAALVVLLLTRRRMTIQA